MRIVLVCAAVLALATGCGSGPGYEEQVMACQEALKSHDFDADPLAQGERLPACDGLKQEDWESLSLNAAMNRLGWLDENGRFDESRMRDSVEG